MPKPTINFSIADNPTKLAGLKQDWQRLFEEYNNNNYFLNFDWNWFSWKYIAEPRGDSLRVIVGYSQKRVVLVWPLVLSTLPGVRILRWLGSQVGDFQDVLVEHSECSGRWLELAWEFVQESPADLVFLHGVRPGSNIETIKAINVDQGELQISPYIDWQQWSNWNQYCAGWKSKFRKDSERQRRRIKAHGKVHLIIARHKEDVPVMIDWIIRAKEHWLKKGGQQDYPWKHHPQYQEFLNKAALDALEKNQLFLGVLKCENKIIAGAMGFQAQGHFRFWKYAYDMNWGQYSPGNLIFIETLRWSFERGHKIFDMMPSAYSYKYNYTHTDLKQYNCFIPLTYTGRLYIAIHRSRYFPSFRSAYFQIRSALR